MSAIESSSDDESVLLVDDEEPDGGGPPGGGPPAPPGPPPRPPGPPGLPLPPGPLANAFWNTLCNSVAWSLVSLPEDTSLWIRSLIFDLMSPGDDWLVLPDWLLLASDCSEELMSVRADDSADWSVELTAPELTSACSSA